MSEKDIYSEEVNEQTEEVATEEQEEVEVAEEEIEQEIVEEDPQQKELDDLKARLLRSQADYDNLRRRSREEREAAAKYRSQPLVESLLPIIDNFERGLLVEVETDEGKSIIEGMEIVYRQLQESLKNEGVEVIEAVGQPFDPNLHQAVMQVEEEGFESGQVIEELQKGYKLKDRVLRPSMVKVNA